MDIYNYVDGSTPKPCDTAQLAIWTHNENTGKSAIMSFHSQDFIYLASNSPILQDTWQAVEDHRNLRNSSTLPHTVQSFFSTEMPYEDILTDYICSYEKTDTYATERCQSANDKLPHRHLRV